MMDSLESRDEDVPFFAHLTTISNHYPFKWSLPIDKDLLPFPGKPEENTLIQNYQNAIFYTDYALGKFWERFKSSPLYDNTIVVVLSDHGIWHFENEDNLTLSQKNEKFYRSPLAIYHPFINTPFEFEQISSHLDIMPTVLRLMNKENPERAHMGKDLTRTHDDPWAIMNKGIDHILRKTDYQCFYDIDQCRTNQQDCQGWKGDIIHEEVQQNLVACRNVTGDLLSGGELTHQVDKFAEFERALQAVKYQNAIKIKSDL